MRSIPMQSITCNQIRKGLPELQQNSNLSDKNMLQEQQQQRQRHLEQESFPSNINDGNKNKNNNSRSISSRTGTNSNISDSHVNSFGYPSFIDEKMVGRKNSTTGDENNDYNSKLKSTFTTRIVMEQFQIYLSPVVNPQLTLYDTDMILSTIEKMLMDESKSAKNSTNPTENLFTTNVIMDWIQIGNYQVNCYNSNIKTTTTVTPAITCSILVERGIVSFYDDSTTGNQNADTATTKITDSGIVVVTDKVNEWIRKTLQQADFVQVLRDRQEQEQQLSINLQEINTVWYDFFIETTTPPSMSGGNNNSSSVPIEENGSNTYDNETSSSGLYTSTIVLVCIGALLFLLGLDLIRRKRRSRSSYYHRNSTIPLVIDKDGVIYDGDIEEETNDNNNNNNKKERKSNKSEANTTDPTIVTTQDSSSSLPITSDSTPTTYQSSLLSYISIVDDESEYYRNKSHHHPSPEEDVDVASNDYDMNNEDEEDKNEEETTVVNTANSNNSNINSNGILPTSLDSTSTTYQTSLLSYISIVYDENDYYRNKDDDYDYDAALVAVAKV